MNAKKNRLNVLTACVLLTLLLTGCGSQSAASQTPPAAGESSSDSLMALCEILGKSDSEVKSLYGGGTENRSEDGALLLGRTYAATLDENNVTLETVYSETETVEAVSVIFTDQTPEAVVTMLTDTFGAPEATDETQAMDSKLLTWTSGRACITFNESYGMSIVELTLTDENLLTYDLGENTLTTFDNREITYEMQGVLGVPAEKNCPVVVLLHGAHPIEAASESRYETGFNYLAQSLRTQGNLVISLNVAINYSFENGEPFGSERTRQILTQQLTLLKQAVEGDREIFGCDLTGRGDFQKIILMGHSRGGLDALECAGALPEGMNIAGVVCVAPAEYKTLDAPIPNVPIGIIIPQMDGDVISLDGSNLYEEVLAASAYTSSTELIYLKWANHAHFNTQLTEPDLNHTAEDAARLLPAEKQRSFLLGYLEDFVAHAAEGSTAVFTAERTLESTAYGCDVLLRVHAGEAETLWSAEAEDPLLCTGGAAAAQVISSCLPAQNTVGTFRMPPLSFERYALQRITWDRANSGVTIPASGSLQGRKFLDLEMAVDSTDLQNKNGQAMTVTFVDESRKTARYAVDGSAAALLWQAGTLEDRTGWDGKPYQEYSTFTPLVTLRLDLSKVSGVELGRLASLRLSWGESPGGSIMLREISAV